MLPAALDQQRKQGFSIPIADWLKAGSFRDLFRSVLTDSKCLFDCITVEDLLRGQDHGRSNAERIFGLVLLGLWRREYQVSL